MLLWDLSPMYIPVVHFIISHYSPSLYKWIIPWSLTMKGQVPNMGIYAPGGYMQCIPTSKGFKGRGGVYNIFHLATTYNVPPLLVDIYYKGAAVFCGKCRNTWNASETIDCSMCCSNIVRGLHVCMYVWW